MHQLIGSLSRYLQGFIHPSWCRISSINNMNTFLMTQIKSYIMYAYHISYFIDEVMDHVFICIINFAKYIVYYHIECKHCYFKFHIYLEPVNVLYLGACSR